jgi:hypothetical protein
MGGYFCVLARSEETGVTLFAFQPRKGNAYTFTIEADGEVKGWGLQEFTARQLFENPSDAVLGSDQLALTGQLLGLFLSTEGWLRGTVLDFDASRTGESEW